MCFDPGNGDVACVCRPGFTGTGIACAPCSVGCPAGTFEIAMCTPIDDRACAPCDPSCATCGGVADQCTSCPLGAVLIGATCVPEMATCRNGIVDLGEMCDDGNPLAGDGCSASCEIEPGFYCFGDVTSRCRAGACIFEPALALPLGPEFALDGTGTITPFGVQFSQRSTIHTTADVRYPIVIEADVTYAGDDTTFIGARGDGLRVVADGDEPTATLRGRLSETSTELAAGPLVVTSTATPFTPIPGAPYRIRYEDDGAIARVTWFDLSAPANGVSIEAFETYHGAADRAFVGGGELGNLTVANLLVCSAPPLPVTVGLVASYSAIESWTVAQDAAHAVTTWADASGNGNDLIATGGNPLFAPGLLNGLAALDFTGGSRLSTAAFDLTTDLTVFAVIVHRTPAPFGAIAHHGDPDDDWSLEQTGANPNTLHLQTNSDTSNVQLVLAQDTPYVLAGRFAANERYLSASRFDGTPLMETAIVDASQTIMAGSKVLHVGTSSAGDASNAVIAGLLYYARALSDLERDQVIAYLRGRWH